MINYDRYLSRSGETMRESAIRKMGAVLAQARDMISFAPGYPAEDSVPWEAFREIAGDTLTGIDRSVLQYGPTRGFRPLRDAIVALMSEREITSSVERILVTTGSQQGLDLVARVFLDPGDVVLVELPSYTGAIAAFSNVGALLTGVAQDGDGIVLDELDRVFRRERAAGRHVKLLYLVPNFQNPTGAMLSRARRQAVLEWAQQNDVLIVEDDPYRDLFFPDVTNEADTRPIAADDAEGRVIYLSSFSKTLAPGFRVAWISAPEPIAAKLELAKQAGDLCSGGLDQRVVYEACRRGLLKRHVPTLREYYQRKRDVMVQALRTHLTGRMTWLDPRGGFFLWARLEIPITSEELLVFAQQQGVIYVVGTAFFVDGGGHDCLRLSFSAPAPDKIEEGVQRLARAVEAATAATSSAGTRPASASSSIRL
jgi:2-aminoadipate transaminase